MPRKPKTQTSSLLEKVKLIGTNAFKSRSSSLQLPLGPTSSSFAQEQNLPEPSHSRAHAALPTPVTPTNVITTSPSSPLMIPTRPPRPSPLTFKGNLESPQLSDIQSHLQTNPSATSNPYMVDAGRSVTLPTSSTNLEKIKTVAFEGLMTTLRVLKESSDAFPPLKSAVGGLLAFMDTVSLATQNKEDFSELDQKLNHIISIIKQHSDGSSSPRFRRRLNEFVEGLNQQVASIHGNDEHGLARRIAEGSKDAGDIAKSFRVIAGLIERFMIDTSLSIERTADDILSNALFQKLRIAEEAKYDASINDPMIQRGGCTAKTREQILDDLSTWAHDRKGSKIYWMIGMAGTGKTTIAYSFCERLTELGMLGASFFCSRSLSECNDVRRIFPTIAYQLARSCPPVASELLEALKKDLSAPLHKQFLELISKPVKVGMCKGDEVLIIVVDALDECTDTNAVRDFLGIIKDHLGVSDLPIKAFITSRPEPVVQKTIVHQLHDSPSVLYLHDVERDLVQSDIARYIKTRLSQIAVDFDLSEQGWPTEAEVNILVDRADKLFIYAATAIRYISRTNGDPQVRLNNMTTFHSTSSSSLKTKVIDDLYKAILQLAYHELEPEEIQTIRLVLGTIISVRNPLTIHGLATLLHLPAERVKIALRSLHSVISLPTMQDGRVSTFHASFPDFLRDTTRCGYDFHFDSFKCHQTLGTRSLNLMNDLLRENICHLDGRPANDAVPRSKVMAYIPDGLAYACIYWVSHLEASGDTKDFQSELYHFFGEHLLHWLECLSLLGSLDVAVGSLQQSILHVSHGSLMMINDARRFVQDNFAVISRYCLEIYYSALVWAPRQSVIRKKYEKTCDRLPKLVCGRRETWGVCEYILRGHSRNVNSVAFSPDGYHVVSGSADHSVRVWNATTGEVEHVMEGHVYGVNSVAFSLDGRHIISGSNDQTIRIWNATTGEVEHALEGHFDQVNSVTFSPNGRHVVSGSKDKTVRIWNATTEEVEHILMGHSDWVTSVAFSPDGRHVASGSNDKTIRIWNATSGEVEHVLKGHSNWVRSVAFSPDGRHVISGSNDKTVRVWNATSGEIDHIREGHSDNVRSVAFSPDGHHVVAGLDDNTLQIWNARTAEAEHMLEGHSNWVRSVAFSPDGQHVVSGSNDKTVRIWNTAFGEVEPLQEGHYGYVSSVAFSPDGCHVGSGSNDKTVRIWNAITGEAEHILEGHSDIVNTVTFSPDGCHVISGSDDKTIRIWNATTGKARILEGHSDGVNSVTFSPNGCHIVSESNDKTVQIWNTMTGEVEHVLEGHSDWVNLVAFSPDGRRVVSGSDDKTVRIWNALTGKIMHILKGHDMNSVAFSLDGNHIISKLDDQTVQIWNAITGEAEGLDQIHQSSDLTSVTMFLSADRSWILNTGTLPKLSIPSSFSGYSTYKFSGSKVCLGYPSGNIIILNMMD